MMMRHMWRYTLFTYIYVYARISLSRALLCSDYFFSFSFYERRVAAHLLLISGTKKTTFPWRASRSSPTLAANVRKAGIFYWTSAIYSGSNIRKCLYPRQHVDNYNKNTFDDLMRTQCIKKLQFPTSAARAKVANRNCVCVMLSSWTALEILSTYGENAHATSSTHNTRRAVSIRTANHSKQNFLKFPQTPSSATGGECWMDVRTSPSICAHNITYCFVRSKQSENNNIKNSN